MLLQIRTIVKFIVDLGRSDHDIAIQYLGPMMAVTIILIVSYSHFILIYQFISAISDHNAMKVHVYIRDHTYQQGCYVFTCVFIVSKRTLHVIIIVEKIWQNPFRNNPVSYLSCLFELIFKTRYCN